MAQLEQLVDRTTELVTLPDVYLRVQQVLADPDHCLDDLVRVLRVDPAMTATLLRLANSAFFGVQARVATVHRAINLLGAQQVHDLLLASAVAGAFRASPDDRFDMDRFWQRSVLCGAAARVLAQRCGVLDGERLFVEGLLHDLGHMVMYQRVPDQAAGALALAVERAMPLHEAEEQLLGFSHAEVGARLCRRWHLPPSLCATVRHHVRPAGAGDYRMEACIVHVGAGLAAAADPARVWPPAPVDAAAWETLGLSPDCLAGVRTEAEEAKANLKRSRIKAEQLEQEAAAAMALLFGADRLSA